MPTLRRQAIVPVRCSELSCSLMDRARAALFCTERSDIQAGVGLATSEDTVGHLHAYVISVPPSTSSGHHSW
jgi:hypothetical protein